MPVPKAGIPIAKAGIKAGIPLAKTGFAAKSMAGFFKLLLWFPVRKAAAIPIVAIGTLSAAGLYGAFDLSRGLTRLAVRPDPKEKQRPGTSAIAAGMTAVVAGGVLLTREIFSKPKMPKSPFLPMTPEQLAKLSFTSRWIQAGMTMAHVIRHYPYQFRFISVFVGGSVGGVTYALTEKARSGPTDAQLQLAARMAKLEALEQREEEEASKQLGQPREKAAVSSLHTAQKALKALVEDAKALVEDVKAKKEGVHAATTVAAPAAPAVAAEPTPAPRAAPAKAASATPATPAPRAVEPAKLLSLAELAQPESDPFYSLQKQQKRGGTKEERKFFEWSGEEDNADAFATSPSSRVVSERR
jgi:hypothetical protein